MRIYLLSLLVLFKVLFVSAATDLSAPLEKNCNGLVCELNLTDDKYTVSSPLLIHGRVNVSIIGSGRTVICLSSRIMNIRIENATNVWIKGIRLMACNEETEEINNPNFEDANFSLGLSIHSCENVEIRDSKFSNFYGTLLHLKYSANVSVSNCIFEGNIRYLFTQGIHYTSPRNRTSQLRISESNFTNMSARPNSNFNYTRNELMNDVHFLSGAGAYLLINNTMDTNITLENSLVFNCSAVSGAGVFLKSFTESSKVVVSIRNTSFIRNVASDYWSAFVVSGGGIDILLLGNDAVKIEIENCLFEHNFAFHGNGGAISHNIYNHKRTYSFESKLTISNCSFLNNSAFSGGTIFVSGRGTENSQFDPFNTLVIESSNFISGYADSGGVIFASMFNIVLQSGNNFTNNTCSVGCVFLLIRSHLEFNGSNVIERNTARELGGAIYIDSSFINLATSLKSYFRENVAGMRGGAIYVNQNLIVPVETQDPYQRPVNFGQCFISGNRDRRAPRLIFIDNHVQMLSNVTDICLGNDIYSKTMFYCSGYTDGPLNLSSILDYFKEMGINLTTTRCSITTDVSRIAFNFLPMCKISDPSQPLHDCNGFDNVTYRKYANTVKDYIRRQNLGNATVNIVFPGYISKVQFQLKDDFNQTTAFDAHIDFFDINVDFSKINLNQQQSDVEMYPPLLSWRPQTNHSVIFTQPKNKMQLVQMCIFSMPFFVVFSCTKVLVTTCPEGFRLERNNLNKLACSPNIYSELNKIFYKREYIPVNGVAIESATEVKAVSPAILALDNSGKSFVQGECLYFKCKCYNNFVSGRPCYVNLLTPNEQCREGLKGRYCTECISPSELPSPPISILRIIYDSCYPCLMYYFWFPLYLALTILITALILSLRIDIFGDYTRSIAFYSSILYLFMLNCGKHSNPVIFDFLSLILSATNLLVSENIPVCFRSKKHGFEFVTLFNNFSPFVYYIYLFVVYMLFQKVSYLQRYNLGRNIHFPMWTLFILTYSNLCVGAFFPFQFNSERIWVYDSFFTVDNDSVLMLTSLIIILIIVIIPVLLIVLSYCARKRFLHLTENFEKRFKPGFKLWEVMKLFWRFFFALLFPLPHLFTIRHQILDNSCVLMSIFCLLLLILNSLYQPATNHFANHFESYCIFILAILGILNTSNSSFITDSITGLLILSPYIIYVAIKTHAFPVKLARKLLKYKRASARNTIN